MHAYRLLSPNKCTLRLWAWADASASPAPGDTRVRVALENLTERYVYVDIEFLPGFFVRGGWPGRSPVLPILGAGGSTTEFALVVIKFKS